MFEPSLSYALKHPKDFKTTFFVTNFTLLSTFGFLGGTWAGATKIMQNCLLFAQLSVFVGLLKTCFVQFSCQQPSTTQQYFRQLCLVCADHVAWQVTMTMPRFCVVCCGKPGGVTATTSPSRKTWPQLGYLPPPLFAGGISISKLSAPKQQVAQVGISRHKKQLGTACKSHCATYKQTIRLALTQLLHIIKVNKARHEHNQHVCSIRKCLQECWQVVQQTPNHSKLFYSI